jgi:SAM-dependent methyltransferase
VIFLLQNPVLFHRIRSFINGDYLSDFIDILGLGEGDRILDVGCGVGEASVLAGPGMSYLGVDIDERYIQYAREQYDRPGVEFQNGQLSEVSGRFSHAILVCVLHHLSEQEIYDLSLRLREMVDGPIGVVDPDAEKSNLFQKFLLYLDRGDYALRPIRGHLVGFEEQYECRQVLTRDTRLKGARLTYSVLTPR